jgi:hypothetical protein
MERLKNLIKEVLSTPPTKKDCNCGCHSCDNVGNPGVVLNESLVKKDILSENLRYHVDKQLPLTENTFRYGSESFINLWAEARSLYLREIIHVNEDDKEILEETDLGNYGLYEGVKVPLDMPVEDVEWPQEVSSRYRDVIFKLVKVMPDRAKYELIDAETGKVFELGGRVFNTIDQLYKSAEDTIKPQGGTQSTYLGEVSKSKKKDPPIGKPKRSSSGGKAYVVYVRDPKTKKIKTVRFGSGGLKAKINNPKARQAFAARHDCKNKTDKTKASYWSCRLPRYAKLLGLKSSFSGFW